MSGGRGMGDLRIALAALALVAGLAGCGGSGGGERTAPAAGTLPQGGERVALDPADLSADVDNRYMPLAPGTRWRYREIDEEGRAQTVVVTATSATERIADGVTARVVRDTVTRGGEVVEDTRDLFAQDGAGNVWYMGEQTAEFEHGRLTTRAGSWQAGVDGAQPGIAMPAAPADGMRYRQEFLAGAAEDRGEVLSVGEQVEVPAGHYGDAILTKDTTPLEPGVVEYKLYAPTVGLVLTLGVSGGGGREELLDVSTVGARRARAAATAPLGRPAA